MNAHQVPSNNHDDGDRAKPVIEDSGEEEVTVLPEDRGRSFKMVASQGLADKLQVGCLV